MKGRFSDMHCGLMNEGILMVELREMTKENFEESLHLKIAESQKAFVSSTVHSLAQAWGNYTLWKLMIDEKYQNK